MTKMYSKIYRGILSGYNIPMMRCAICYHLCNLKNVTNTHGGVLPLVNPAPLLKVNSSMGTFHVF